MYCHVLLLVVFLFAGCAGSGTSTPPGTQPVDSPQSRTDPAVRADPSVESGALPAPNATLEVLREEVWATERAFAATMAARDHEAFTGFLSEHAIFFAGPGVLRGRDAVAAGWKPYFEAEGAPFSWEPDAVEVSAAGDLALSTGPVLDADGNRVGRFNSIWRLECDGWRIVFDKGEEK